MHKVQVTSARVNIPVSSNQDVLAAAKGSGILFVGQIIEQGSLVIFTILLTRTLGATSYGLYSVGIGIALILATVAMLGLPDGMMRFLPVGVSEHNADKIRTTFFIGACLPPVVGLSIGIIFFSLGEVLATNLFHEPSVASVIRLFSVIIPLEAIGRVLLGTAIGLKRVNYQVYCYSVGFSLSRLAFTALFLYVGWDIMGVVLAYSLAWIITIGVLFYLLNRVVSLRETKQVAWKDFLEHISFSAPLCLSDIMIQFRGYVDLLVIGIIGTMASVGVYSAATRVQLAGNLLLSPIANIAKPIISDLDYRAEKTRLKSLYQTLTRWSLSFTLPLVITIILYPRQILAIFGDEFVKGVPVLIIIAMGMIVNAATRICHSMVSMTGNSKWTFITTLLSLILNIIFDIILIPRWGIIGSAVGTLFVITIVGLFRLFQVYFLIGLWPYDWTIVKPLIAAAVVLLMGFFANRFLPAENNLFFFVVYVLVLCFCYGVAIVILGLSEEDHAVLSRVNRKLNNILSK